MRLLEIQHRSIHYLFELSEDNLRHLHFILDNMSIDFNGENEEEKKAIEYLTTNLHPQINELYKHLENPEGPDASN